MILGRAVREEDVCPLGYCVVENVMGAGVLEGEISAFGCVGGSVDLKYSAVGKGEGG